MRAPDALKFFFGTPVDGVAANAAAALRTATLDVIRFAQLAVVIDLSQSAATALTMTMAASVDGGTTYGDVQSMSVSSGTGTLSDMTWTKAVSGDVTITLDLPVVAYSNVQLVFAATGGGASDLITVTIMGGAGK